MDRELKSLTEQIEKLIKENKDERKNIEDEAWESIDMIKERNTKELATIIEQSMSSKAELTKVTGEYKQ